MAQTRAQALFDEAARRRLTEAIRATELKTSGEVCVYVEDEVGALGDAFARAREKFHQLGLTSTAERNGVLLYLALVDRKFAILGDQGIDARVPAGFWDATRDAMSVLFRQGQFVEGLTLGVARAGDELARFFPRRADDVNELSDEIHVG